MTANLYCSRADVNRTLPLGAIPSPSGIAAQVLASTNAVTYDGHGLETDDPVSVRAFEGGTIPSPLVADTTYYAIRLSNSTFELAATPGGSAIDLTTDGVSVVVVREPDYDRTIERYSRWADTMMPAHVVPLTEPIHPLVKGIVADLVAKKLFNVGGQASQTLDALEVSSKAQLERFAAGIPLRGAPITTSANLAVRSTTNCDPRGWGSQRLP